MLDDLRFAFRTLRKSKGFTAIAALALALGIGGTAVMYSVVSGVLLRPLPFPQGDRLVRVWESWAPGTTGSVARENFDDWRAQAKSLELLTVAEGLSENLARGGRAERLEAVRVSSDFFPILGLKPALGRPFSKEAYVDQASEVILSNATWQRWFGGQPDAIGATLSLSGRPYTVVGVLPASLRIPDMTTAIYLPIGPTGHGRGSHYLYCIGRLTPGATVEEAQTELNTIAARLEATYPDSNKNRRVVLANWHESIVRGVRPALLLLLGAVVLVLLISCANVANMLLARAAAREGELAVRFALGASRWRVVRQLLTESAILAALGAGGGLLLASWGVELTAGLLPEKDAFTIGLDVRVAVFAIVVAAVSVLLFGLIPALRAASGDVRGALQEGMRTVAGGRTRLKSALVVGQVGLSFALLVGAGLLGRSFLRLAAVDPGFDPSHVATLQVALPKDRDAAPYYTRLLDELRATPGVTAAGVVDFLPLQHSNISGDFEIEGRPWPAGSQIETTEYMIASPGYFDAMGMRIVAGRGITAADRADSRPIAVVNQRFARKYFGDENPIGRRLKIDWNEPLAYEIVGIVNDVKRWSLADDQARPETWLPFAQVPYNNMALAVRGPGDPAQLAETLRRAAAKVDPEQAVYDVATMSHILDDSLADRRLLMSLLGGFAAIALLLAAVGLYGVLAVQVAQRTHELGIRMALGARAGDVRALVVGHGLRLALLGVVTGAVCALALGGVLGKLLYGVSTTDPMTFVGVGGALVAVALAATWLPARRATKIDPMIALRSS